MAHILLQIVSIVDTQCKFRKTQLVCEVIVPMACRAVYISHKLRGQIPLILHR